LSADERERAARFCNDRLKTGYALSRGVLRALLGRYLAIEPDQVRFGYGVRGKPRIEFPESAVEFNLSHSGTRAVYAFAVGCELGVDIELVRCTGDYAGIVRRYFSPEECEEWQGLDLSQRDDAFFQCWTRKEAYIKALGDGLAKPLDSFRVSLRPSVRAELLYDSADPAAASRWSILAFHPADGYAGALAVPERGRQVRMFPRLSAAGVLDLGSGPAWWNAGLPLH
jgi:4'-phosphopantetheinyl transferase